MRLVFTTGSFAFERIVKDFKLGERYVTPDEFQDDFEYGVMAESINEVNYAKQRKLAVGETDFVQTLFRSIIPALHCLYLLRLCDNFCDLDECFKTQLEKDNLLWVLLFLSKLS